MNVLAVSLTQEDKVLVAEVLDKVFLYQDKPISAKRLAVYVDEICSWGYPLSAILDGLRSFFNLDVSHIKLAHIRDAIAECIPASARAESQSVELCPYCHGGLVTMRGTDGNGTVVSYRTSMACVCSRGDMYANKMRMVRWKGKRVQYLPSTRLYYRTEFDTDPVVSEE